MSDNIFLCQPAYILHQQNYRESSLLLEVLTRDFGRISLIAKGVRKAKSKSAALLRPFQLLSLSYSGRSELKTMTGVEAASRALTASVRFFTSTNTLYRCTGSEATS